MCGIIGCAGNRSAAAFLLDGLFALEYRGYDSAGIAVLEPGKGIGAVKTRGKVSALRDRLYANGPTGTLGIGHTRWATHGEPSDVNAHPHLNKDGTIAVVHNGIIENHLELRRWLTDEGYSFRSETDSEVVVHLLDYYGGKKDLLTAMSKTVQRLTGSYALAVISAHEPDVILCVRKDSPLVIGLGEGENYLSSDIPALLPYTRRILLLPEGAIAVVGRHDVRVMDYDLHPACAQPMFVDWDITAAKKGGYAHFMKKEIMEQPEAVRKTVAPRIQQGHITLDGLGREELERIRRIVICGCGTAYHAGLMGKYMIEGLSRVLVEVDVASEFRYRNPILSEGDLCVVISQSGETADTVAALRMARERKAAVLAITNVVGSTVAREADYVMYTWAGPEIAVASTKAYTTQLACLVLLAMELGWAKGTLDKDEYNGLCTELLEMPERIREVLELESSIRELARRHYNRHDMFFIGRGIDYPASMESSLKLKEISYIHSEAMAGGELKHGTIAMIEEDTLVIAICTQRGIMEKTASAIGEVKARGARVLAITLAGYEPILHQADEAIVLPEMGELFSGMVSVVAAQLFSYHCSVLRGLDPDQPRNLAKSVTVE